MGFVGSSKLPSVSYNLATNLLRETEVRGNHATGFYSVNNQGKLDFHKEPIRATEFVRKSKAWKNFASGSSSLIGHTRLATHGAIHDNINNHPHISTCGNMGLVHNGIISSHLSIARNTGVIMRGDCDSEVLLRVFEKNGDRVENIKEIFEQTDKSFGSMACLAIDYFEKNIPFFYAFRNSGNPLFFIDLRDHLGQYFFCSTKEIWNMAIRKCGLGNKYKDIVPEPVPHHQVWRINPVSMDIEKFDIQERESEWLNIVSADRTNILQLPYDGDYYYSEDSFRENAVDRISARLINIRESIEIITSTIQDYGNSKEPFVPDESAMDDDLSQIEAILQDLESNIPLIHLHDEDEGDLYYNDDWDEDFYGRSRYKSNYGN